MSNKKESIIIGALTSSAGVFVTKLMGIFYLSPLTALAGEGNLAYYSYAYGVYDNLLNIVEAGIPFAIATLVAKYYLKEDYKAIKYIKKLSKTIMLGFGFFAFCICLFGSGLIAKFITPDNISAQGLTYTKNVLIIIGTAFFTVPLLAGNRGYFQGLKDLKAYAFSQVLEQFVRISFLLTCAFVCVSLLALDGIYAIYGAVGSAFISSLVALIELYLSRKKIVKKMDYLADQQEETYVEYKDLLKELIIVSLPYLATSILGNSMNIVNTNFFASAMDMAGYEAVKTTILYSMIMVTTNKLTSIPQFLSKGYSAAIIPYITQSYEKGDKVQTKKYILDCLNSVCYIGLPLCFYLFALGPEIYYVMYGSKTSWQLGGEVLSFASFLALTGTISPVVTSLTMSLKFSKQAIINLAIGFAVKCISFYPLILWMGYTGAIWSSVLCGFVIISLNLYTISKNYSLSYKSFIRRVIKMLLACGLMYLGFSLLKLVGLTVCDKSRMLALVCLGVYGLIGLIAYLSITYLMRLPQVIFHFTSIKDAKKIIRR